MPSAERMRKIRIALIGCGAIARTHARTLRRFPAVELAFASRDRRRAAEYARRYKGVSVFGSYQDAMADRDVNAVMILTPPADHFRLALEAILVGKDVLVEKPAFLSTAEADLIAAAAVDAGRRVLVLENYGYKPSTLLLRRLIDEGEVGDVRFIRLNALKWQDAWGWRTDEALAGGGALFEGGVHWIHLLGALGSGIAGVEGHVPRSADPGERGMLVVARFASGAIGTLHHAWNAPVRWRGLSLSHVIGSRGTITFESNGAFVALNGARRRRLWVLPGHRDLPGFKAMFDDMIGSLRDGTTPLVTLARAREDLRLLEAACGRGTPPMAVAC